MDASGTPVREDMTTTSTPMWSRSQPTARSSHMLETSNCSSRSSCSPWLAGGKARSERLLTDHYPARQRWTRMEPVPGHRWLEARGGLMHRRSLPAARMASGYACAYATQIRRSRTSVSGLGHARGCTQIIPLCVAAPNQAGSHPRVPNGGSVRIPRGEHRSCDVVGDVCGSEVRARNRRLGGGRRCVRPGGAGPGNGSAIAEVK